MTSSAPEDPTTENTDVSRVSKLSEEIDELLVKYLHLLDKYTTLRSSIVAADKNIRLNIAQANFSVSNGIRFGSDFYDDRVQAIKTCCVTAHGSENSSPNAGGAAVYTVSKSRGCHEGDATSENDGMNGNTEAAELNGEGKTAEPADTNGGDAEKERKKEKKKPKVKDPISMFGVLVPPALRTAQMHAERMVETTIPQIVSVDAEMKELEIRIRRARKYRAKEQAKEDALQLARANIILSSNKQLDNTGEGIALLTLASFKVGYGYEQDYLKTGVELQAAKEAILRGQKANLLSMEKQRLFEKVEDAQVADLFMKENLDAYTAKLEGIVRLCGDRWDPLCLAGKIGPLDTYIWDCNESLSTENDNHLQAHNGTGTDSSSTEDSNDAQESMASSITSSRSNSTASFYSALSSLNDEETWIRTCTEHNSYQTSHPKKGAEYPPTAAR
ncbi:hypothetical protein G7Y89_g12147 [Cudoniella acicularis]|uniref:Vacuolar ATPase assembly protein VMA22 n=1 Tax=Cudoniella acicularis TaxID=354080 RepID=A0A8H4RAM6_9HELO|nr:hypothetical protein G7Y89_g12147 [Cudoniella acicularis]